MNEKKTERSDDELHLDNYYMDDKRTMYKSKILFNKNNDNNDKRRMILGSACVQSTCPTCLMILKQRTILFLFENDKYFSISDAQRSMFPILYLSLCALFLFSIWYKDTTVEKHANPVSMRCEKWFIFKFVGEKKNKEKNQIDFPVEWTIFIRFILLLWWRSVHCSLQIELKTYKRESRTGNKRTTAHRIKYENSK